MRYMNRQPQKAPKGDPKMAANPMSLGNTGSPGAATRAGRSRAVDRRPRLQRGREPAGAARRASSRSPGAAQQQAAGHRSHLRRRRQPRCHARDRARALRRRARCPGGLAVAQFRQGGGAARRPRSCAARRRAVHGRRWPASAVAGRDAGRLLARSGLRRRLHRQSPPRERALAAPACRCAASMPSSTGARGRRSRRTPATSACSPRARRRRCEQLPERNRFFKGLASWIGFRQIRVDYEPAARAHGQASGTSIRCSACRSRGSPRSRSRRCGSRACWAC